MNTIMMALECCVYPDSEKVNCERCGYSCTKAEWVKIDRKLAIDILALLKEQTPAIGGWISVKDRLPNNQNPVIVAVPPHTDAEGEEYIGYVGMAYYTYTGNGGMWCGTDGAVYGAIGEIATPTHWMPIPKAPEDENGDGDNG